MSSRTAVANSEDPKHTLLEAGKVPSQPKKANPQAADDAALQACKSTADLSLALAALCKGWGKAGHRVDLSSSVFEHTKTDDFVKHLSKATKELRISGWAELSLLSFDKPDTPLSKLRRVELSHCGLTTVNLDGLVSIESLVLSHNQLTEVPRLTANRKKLAYVDLSHNCIKNGFHFFTVCTKLRVLDLASNDFDMVGNEFNRVVVSRLKSCSKLEYLSVVDNPKLAANCPDLNSFLVHEFPKLAFLNWKPVSKDNKRMAELKERRGKFDSYNLPFDNSPAPAEVNGKAKSVRPRSKSVSSRMATVSPTLTSGREAATIGRADRARLSSTRLRSASIPACNPTPQVEPVLVASPEPASWRGEQLSKVELDDLARVVPTSPGSIEVPELPPRRSSSRRASLSKKPLSNGDAESATQESASVTANVFDKPEVFPEQLRDDALATIRGQQGFIYRVPQTDLSKKNKVTAVFKLQSSPKFPAWNTRSWEESTWREMPQLVRVTKRELRCHEKVLREIFTSEYRFSNQLESLVAVEKHLLDIAKGATKKTKPLLSADEIRSVFGDVSPILAFSSTLIKSLTEVGDIQALGPRDNFEGAFKSFNAVKGFVKVLSESIPFFRVFQRFYGSYQASFAMLEKCAREREQLREYLALVHTFNADSHGLSVPDLLVTPVQRVPRIKMLLSQLADELGAYATRFVLANDNGKVESEVTEAPRDQIRVDEVVAAAKEAQLLVMQLHDNLSEVLAKMNAEMSASGLRKRFEELVVNSEFAPNLRQFVAPQRRLLWEGAGKVSDAPVGHAFLFSDVLVVLKRDVSPKPKKETGWSLDRVLDVEDMWIVASDRALDSSVSCVSLDTTFTLQGLGVRQALTLAMSEVGVKQRRRAASVGF